MTTSATKLWEQEVTAARERVEQQLSEAHERSQDDGNGREQEARSDDQEQEARSENADSNGHEEGAPSRLGRSAKALVAFAAIGKGLSVARSVARRRQKPSTARSAVKGAAAGSLGTGLALLSKNERIRRFVGDQVGARLGSPSSSSK